MQRSSQRALLSGSLTCESTRPAPSPRHRSVRARVGCPRGLAVALAQPHLPWDREQVPFLPGSLTGPVRSMKRRAGTWATPCPQRGREDRGPSCWNEFPLGAQCGGGAGDETQPLGKRCPGKGSPSSPPRAPRGSSRSRARVPLPGAPGDPPVLLQALLSTVSSPL